MRRISKTRARFVSLAGSAVRFSAFWLALLLSSCASGPGWSPYPDTMDDLSPMAWIQDLKAVQEGLHRLNPHLRSDAAIRDALSARIGELSDSLMRREPGTLGALSGAELADRMTAELHKLMSLVGEGHSSLNAYPQSRFPLFVQAFSASGGALEWRLTAVDPSFLQPLGSPGPAEAALGARVLGLRAASGEFMPWEEVEAVLAPAISHEADLAPYLVREARLAALPSRLMDPRLMAGLGLAERGPDGIRRLALELVNPRGGRFGAFVEESAGRPWKAQSARTGMPRGAAEHSPESRFSLRVDHAGRPSEAGEYLFVSYSSCDPEAKDFFAGILADLDRAAYRGMILDLRRNGGGNSLPGTWFARSLGAREPWAEDDRVAVLISPSTFSSGMWLAVDLMEETDAFFAGLPICESPDSWGEVKRFSLPSSGLVLGTSTRYFSYSRGKNLRLSHGVIVPEPGLSLRPSYAEWLEGRDPVLEVALAELARRAKGP